MYDSTYPRKNQSGPTEAVVAVWMVLQQNWPSAFKNVDQTDPAGVWRSNIDALSSRAIELGLIALRRCDDRYMPNAPSIRKIMQDTIRSYDKQATDAEGELEEVDALFLRVRGFTWMQYIRTIVIEKRFDISGKMSSACFVEAVKVTSEYEAAWRTEPDKGHENWMAICHAVVNGMLKRWNVVCDVPDKKRIWTYSQLYDKG